MFESIQRLRHLWLPKPMQDFHHQFKVCFRPQKPQKPVKCHHKIPFNCAGDQDGLREAWLQQFPLRSWRLHWALAWFRSCSGQWGVTFESNKCSKINVIHLVKNSGFPAADDLCPSYLAFEKWKISSCQLIERSRSMSANLMPALDLKNCWVACLILLLELPSLFVGWCPKSFKL